jgi:glutamate formiminotransferase
MTDVNSDDFKDLQEIRKQKNEQKIKKEKMATWKPNIGLKKEVEDGVRSKV